MSRLKSRFVLFVRKILIIMIRLEGLNVTTFFMKSAFLNGLKNMSVVRCVVRLFVSEDVEIFFFFLIIKKKKNLFKKFFHFFFFFLKKNI